MMIETSRKKSETLRRFLMIPHIFQHDRKQREKSLYDSFSCALGEHLVFMVSLDLPDTFPYWRFRVSLHCMKPDGEWELVGSDGSFYIYTEDNYGKWTESVKNREKLEETVKNLFDYHEKFLNTKDEFEYTRIDVLERILAENELVETIIDEQMKQALNFLEKDEHKWSPFEMEMSGLATIESRKQRLVELLFEMKHFL